MHHVRGWAHNTARESRYNPWYSSFATAEPPDQVEPRLPSPLSHVANNHVRPETNDGEVAEPDKATRKIPMTRRVWLNVKRALFHSWVNVLLVFVPAGIAVHFAGVNPNIVFALNAIAIIPLAGLLTYATESVAHRLGPTLGALLNVSFGNAVELIIFIIALVKDEIRIVQASLVGSILANLLLILGMAFLIGGLEYREQVYDSTVTQMSACLLALAVLSLLIPTAFHASFNDLQLADAAVLKVSRGTSVILLLTYVLYLLFQLKSHSYLYQGTPQHIIDEQSQPGVLARFDSSSSSSSSIASRSSTRSGGSGSHRKLRKRFQSKLGIKRHTKTEISNEPDETIEQNEKGGIMDTAIVSSGSHQSPTSVSEADVTRHGAHEVQDEEQVDKIGELRSSQIRNTRPQLATRFTAPVAKAVDQSPASVTDSAKRPMALRAISSFRAPPVFRSETNPQVQCGPRTLPNHQLRRQISAPNTVNVRNFTGLSHNTTPQSISKRPTDASSIPTKDEPPMSQTASIVLLLCSTALVALCAEFLVGSIEHLVESSPLSEAFVGLIILPVVGNAAEHVTAVTVAAKNKLDLSLGVSLGSSIQIALFVTPIVVILGWILDKTMSLYFNLFETASLFVSTFIVNFLVLDGRSNYLEGALLCATYVILAVAAYFFPDGQEQSALAGGSGQSRR